MYSFVKNALVTLTANEIAQRLLEWNLFASQYFMGIGPGGGVKSSGESAIIQRLWRCVNKAPLCVFDVGANKGQFLSLVTEGLRGREYRIHAFEPSRYTFGLLQQNFGAMSGVTLNNAALGKTCGEQQLFFDAPGSGLASLHRRRLAHAGMAFDDSEIVQVSTLDSYCEKSGIVAIDLLKLDVEGHEMDVLQGGLRLFQERRISMLSFEFGGCNIDSRTFFQDFWYFLVQHGMGQIYRVTPGGFLMPVTRYSERHEQFSTTNFLAVLGKG